MLRFLHFLFAMTILCLIMALPVLLFIFIIAILADYGKKKYGTPTPEERAAYDLRQIRYNLEDLNAKKDIEMWTKKKH